MTALLVIDMLEDFFEDGFLKSVRADLTASINQLIEYARRAAIPVVWVRQEFREDLRDAFLAMRKNDIRITIKNTPGSQILSELDKTSGDIEVIKKRYSAFYSTELDQIIAKLGITHLIVTGVNTHACIRTAAIDAYQRDLEVTIPRECVASNDVTHHDVTLEYLDREIASVVRLEDLLSRLAISQ